MRVETFATAHGHALHNKSWVAGEATTNMRAGQTTNGDTEIRPGTRGTQTGNHGKHPGTKRGNQRKQDKQRMWNRGISNWTANADPMSDEANSWISTKVQAKGDMTRTERVRHKRILKVVRDVDIALTLQCTCIGNEEGAKATHNDSHNDMERKTI